MDVDKWQQFHSGKWVGTKLIHKHVTGSTNLDAAALSGELPHGAVVVADQQTAGRGRRGRTWASHAGENLYFSLLLKPDFLPDMGPMLTLIMALAVAEGIELAGDGTGRYVNEAQIKWPNDIVIHGKKVCGILTEMQLEAGQIKHVVIGVGVNVSHRAFATEGLAHASSLEQELGGVWKSPVNPEAGIRELLLNAILTQFERYYEQFCQAGSLIPLRENYQARLVNLGREVQVLDPGGSFNGAALGIDEQGRLIVQKADGTVTKVYAGEVSVRGLYGYV